MQPAGLPSYPLDLFNRFLSDAVKYDAPQEVIYQGVRLHLKQGDVDSAVFFIKQLKNESDRFQFILSISESHPNEAVELALGVLCRLNQKQVLNRLIFHQQFDPAKVFLENTHFIVMSDYSDIFQAAFKQSIPEALSILSKILYKMKGFLSASENGESETKSVFDALKKIKATIHSAQQLSKLSVHGMPGIRILTSDESIICDQMKEQINSFFKE